MITRLLLRMQRIEENFGEIYIRVGTGEDYESVPIKEVPSEVAMQYIFKWLREVINETT